MADAAIAVSHNSFYAKEVNKGVSTNSTLPLRSLSVPKDKSCDGTSSSHCDQPLNVLKFLSTRHFFFTLKRKTDTLLVQSFINTSMYILKRKKTTFF